LASRGRLADHLSDRAQRDRNPARALVRAQRIEKLQVRHRREQRGIGRWPRTRRDLKMVLMPIAGNAADEKRGHLQFGRQGRQAGNGGAADTRRDIAPQMGHQIGAHAVRAHARGAQRIERKTGRLDRARGQHDGAVGRKKRRTQKLLLIVDPQFELGDPVARRRQLDDLRSRQDHQASPRIDVVPPTEPDVLADCVEQQVGAAVLVEGEEAGGRRCTLDGERGLLDRLAGAHDAVEPCLQPVEQRPGNVVGRRKDAHFCFDVPVIGEKIARGISRPRRFAGRSGAEIYRRQARRPAAPKQRPAAETVGQSGEFLVAAPRMPPNQILGSRILRVHGDLLLRGRPQPDARQVLDMRGQEKVAGVHDKHPQTNVVGMVIELFGDIAAEHARPDDDDIERVAAVVADLVPGTAGPPAENIVGEVGLLDIDRDLGIGIQAAQHRNLLIQVLTRSRNSGWLAAGFRPFALTRDASCGLVGHS
jgi:hypothetical protein